MKYQFSIRFQNNTATTAASKAILDCNEIFLKNHYQDYSLTVWDNKNKIKYYYSLLKEIITFFLALKKNSLVGIQYPLLSINNVFKLFINAARLKNVKFFCIIHDLESLRTGGNDDNYILKEISNLNYFDLVIAHNNQMIQWLKDKGLKQKAIPLGIFDYLSEPFVPKENVIKKTIVFAGNLNKSIFIYSLSNIKKWSFNVYGANFNAKSAIEIKNVKWRGEYLPEVVVRELEGNFGLIWDGHSIAECDEVLGNYLRYNNPHKFSLYIAAGLPIIAPINSAIGKIIRNLNIGLLIKNLYDLDKLYIDENNYIIMKQNILRLREKIIAGDFFDKAIYSAEKILEVTGK